MEKKDRSPLRIVHSALDLKSWLKKPPGVEEARPGQCPACESPSRPAGGPLGLWGHGQRQRQQRGPLSAEGAPEIVVFAARRYLCRSCGAVLVVVPRGVAPRRHYSASAIALALALWGLLGLPPPQVRERVSPWRVVGAAAARGWATLRRWAAAVRRGVLFAGVRACPPRFTAREVAERAASTLSALCPVGQAGGDLSALAFLGGARMA